MLKTWTMASALIVLVTLIAPPASADFPGVGVTGTAAELTSDGAAAETRRGSAASDGDAGPKRRAPQVECTYHRFSGSLSAMAVGDVATDVRPGQVVARKCRNVSTGQPSGIPTFITVATPADVNPLPGLIDRARAELTLPTPSIATSPPGGETLPHIDTWFWTDVATTTASADGNAISVTVTATPTNVTFAGDGQSVDCPDGGTAYRPDAAERSQHSTCIMRFAPPTHDVTVTAEATWSITWEASTGESGDLGTTTSTATMPLTVASYATVIRG